MHYLYHFFKLVQRMHHTFWSVIHLLGYTDACTVHINIELSELLHCGIYCTFYITFFGNLWKMFSCWITTDKILHLWSLNTKYSVSTQKDFKFRHKLINKINLEDLGPPHGQLLNLEKYVSLIGNNQLIDRRSCWLWWSILIYINNWS